MNEIKDIISNNTKGYKKLIKLCKRANLNIDEATIHHPIYGEEIAEILKYEKAAKNLIVVKRVERLKESCRRKIHHLKTKDGKSKTFMTHRKNRQRAIRNSLMKDYPPEIINGSEELKKVYRETFTKYYNSGIGPDLSQHYTLRDLNL